MRSSGSPTGPHGGRTTTRTRATSTATSSTSSARRGHWRNWVPLNKKFRPPLTGDGRSGAAAVSGYPDITVPAGYDAGLPLGITFIGPRWGEPKLLGLAYDYEQATHVRVPPQLAAQGGGQPGMPRTGNSNEWFLTVM